MRVLEDSAAASTSCAIMNEDRNVNGASSDGCSKKGDQNHGVNCDFNESSTTTAGGGRLKFYKDGKFILELSHRREGEKMSWIPVPKKTYWPPPGTSATVTNSIRQESTASLSVSDDNSSVQLSPWQRDHCWKQASPRKAAGLEMTFLMVPLPRALFLRRAMRAKLKRRRRRPFDPIDKLIDLNHVPVGANGYQRLKSCAMKNGGTNMTLLIQRLWECVKTSETQPCVQKHSPSMFSPRKRILRELERVSLVTNNVEDQSQSNLKRQRQKTSNGGVSQQTVTPSNSKGVSSYSITSLLATKEEPSPSQDQEPSVLRNLLRSPKEEASPEPSPKSRRGSPPLLSPPPGYPPVASVHPVPYVHPQLLYPHFLTPVAHHSFFSNVSSYRSTPSHAPHPPHALWSVPFPVSSLAQGSPYQGLVPSYGSPGYQFPWPSTSDVKREDTSSDVPLNLSKHAG